MVDRISQSSRARWVVLAAFALVCVASAWWTPLDGVADQYASAGLNRALGTFAAARGIEAVISLFQSATVSGGFLVGGLSVSPAAVLAPARELIERFSSVVLLASASFAMQKLILTVMKSGAIAFVTSALCFLWLLSCYFRARTTPILGGVLVAFFILRLFVPITGALSMEIHKRALANEYLRSEAAIDQISPDGPASQGTMLDRIKQRFGQALDVGAKVEEVRARVGAMSEHMVRLAAIYLLETIVLPIAWLACAFLAARALTRWIANQFRFLPGRASNSSSEYPIGEEGLVAGSQIH